MDQLRRCQQRDRLQFPHGRRRRRHPPRFGRVEFPGYGLQRRQLRSVLGRQPALQSLQPADLPPELRPQPLFRHAGQLPRRFGRYGREHGLGRRQGRRLHRQHPHRRWRRRLRRPHRWRGPRLQVGLGVVHHPQHQPRHGRCLRRRRRPGPLRPERPGAPPRHLGQPDRRRRQPDLLGSGQRRQRFGGYDRMAPRLPSRPQRAAVEHHRQPDDPELPGPLG